MKELFQGGQSRKKMLENEKDWINPSIYQYNMHCTVSCWTVKEHDDRKWVCNRGEEVNLIKAWYSHTWNTKAKLH
jgi:hypothetical protein